MTSEKDAFAYLPPDRALPAGSIESDLMFRLDALEMALCRLLAVLATQPGDRFADAVFKATGQRALTGSEAFILAQIRERIGDRQV